MPTMKITKTLALLAGAALLATTLGAGPVLAVDTGGGGGSSSDSSAAVSGPSLADARALIRAQKWPQAIKMLKAIISNSPNNADALNLMGFSLRKSGDTKNALGFYNKALQINPRHKGAHEYLGELYVQTGQLAKARAQLETLARLCGNTSCEEYEDLEKAINGA